MLSMKEDEFIRIVPFVRDNFGIDLAKKRALIQGRLAFYIEKRGYKSFDEYFDRVISHPNGEECQRLIDKLSTNHTYFFRETACFEHMRDCAVPSFIRNGVRHIDVWCAASSTGQECYTAAMMLDEALSRYPGVSYGILGSDISLEALEAAKAGVYKQDELDNIPERFKRRCCRMLGDGRFEIAKAIKDKITWRQVNLVRPLGAMGRFHIIFCRNVMIYFEPATKDRLTSELYKLVYDDGYVYVGTTETLDIKRTRFKCIIPSVFSKSGR